MSDVVTQGRLPDGFQSDVLHQLHTKLTQSGSSLVDDELLDRGLQSQVESIIGEVLDTLSHTQGTLDNAKGTFGSQSELTRHAVMSARQGVEPSDALAAGVVLFEVLLDALRYAPELVRGRSDFEVAKVTHSAIWRRFAPGASAYVNLLRSQLNDALLDGRRRYSRQLHDDVAQNIVAAMHRVELNQIEQGDSSNQRAVHDILLTVLQTTRDLAFDLRQGVGEAGIYVAMMKYTQESKRHI